MKRLFLSICCTDRGQHPWTPLGNITADAKGVLQVNVGAAYNERASRLVDDCVWIDEEWNKVHLRCNRCGRHPQLSFETATALIEGKHSIGDTQFDISKA